MCTDILVHFSTYIKIYANITRALVPMIYFRTFKKAKYSQHLPVQVLKIRHLPRLSLEGVISLLLHSEKGKDKIADSALGSNSLAQQRPGRGTQVAKIYWTNSRMTGSLGCHWHPKTGLSKKVQSDGQ